MQLVRHFERGYGHAERQNTETNCRARYIVRFFDSYDIPCIFYETDFTTQVLEFIEGE